jgi:hypothetical protein
MTLIEINGGPSEKNQYFTMGYKKTGYQRSLASDVHGFLANADFSLEYSSKGVGLGALK